MRDYEAKRKEVIISFIGFLKKKGCYRTYLQNLHKDGQRLSRFLKTESFYHFVTHAFLWFKTEEGSEYWEDIAHSWISYLDCVLLKDEETY